MGALRSLAGTIWLEITSADPSRTLAALNENGIDIHGVTHEDPFTVVVQLARRDHKVAVALVQKKGGEVKLLQRSGIYWRLTGLLKRPVFLLTLGLILTLTAFLPRKVLFVYVEGNSSLPEKLILEKAEACGIGFGASREDVRSEKMKNALLHALPQLEWAGINTTGCVAVISVRERNAEEALPPKPIVSSIVAARDGIILDAIVTKGNLLCKVGQAVKAGQTLVSGYTDCGISIKAEAAQGEIYAQTLRELAVSALQENQEKTRIISRQKVYTLRWGKQLLELFRSGQRDGEVTSKTRKEIELTLFGGFTLPVGLLVEEYTCYETQNTRREDSEPLLSKYARDYLVSQMISGQIIGSEACMQDPEDSSRMRFTFYCMEMIGQIRIEKDFSGVKTQ